MTTSRQLAANRRNARRSTGPRTGAGKSKASQNARRHGLARALDHEVVVAWYRVIVENDDAVPDPFEQNPRLQAAAELARAEARLQRVRDEEERWWRDATAVPRRRPPPSPSEQFLIENREWFIERLVEEAIFGPRLRVAPEGRFFSASFQWPQDADELHDLLVEHANNPLVVKGWDRQGFRLLRRTDRLIARDRLTREANDAKRGRLLARYRASAEAQRRIALRQWIKEIEGQEAKAEQ